MSHKERQQTKPDGWLTIREAVIITGYTAAYLSRLAKGRQVLAQKKGRIWQINRLSLENLLERREESDRLRRAELKLKRRQEIRNLKPVFPEPEDREVQILEIGIFSSRAVLATLAIFLLSGIAALSFGAVEAANLTLSDLQTGADSLSDQLEEGLGVKVWSQTAASWAAKAGW